MSRQVVVEQLEHQVSVLDKKGNERIIGTILAEDYQQEVKRFMFSPDTSNPWTNEGKLKNAYQLGTGSKNMSFINPAEAQQVLLDQGWIIQHQYANMGGLSMQTIFIKPESPFSDPYDFDRPMWAGRDSFTRCWPAIILNTNLMIGRIAAEFVAGIYRQICTNGMTASILQMPAIRFRHIDWEVETAAERIKEEMATTYHGLPRGPEVATISGMRSTLNLLSAYTSQDTEKPDPRFNYITQNFGGLSPNVVKPWAMQNYLAHLRAMMVSKKQGENIYGMDIVNAYTSAVNQHRLENHTDRGVMAALAVTEGVVQSTVAIASFAALFGEN